MIPGVHLNLAWYLFLGGMGAGLYVMSAMLRAVVPERRGRAFAEAYLLEQTGAVVLVALGAVFLFADLGVRSRFALVLAGIGHSVISLGAWAILLFELFAIARIGITLAAGPRRLVGVARACGALAVAFALVICVYAGSYLYALGPAVPFWNSPSIVALMAVSSLGTGLAVALAIEFFCFPARVAQATPLLARVDRPLKWVELGLFALFLASRLLSLGRDQGLAFEFALGSYAPAVWLGAVACGLIAPLVLEGLARRPQNGICVLLAAIAAMVGGFALRCCIIFVQPVG